MKHKKLVIASLLLALLVATTTSGAVAFAAMELSCEVKIVINEGVASIGICLGTTYNAYSATIYTSSGTFTAVPLKTYSWKATAKSGYVMSSSSGTISPTALALNEISPTATKADTYTLTVTKKTGVASIKVTYGSSSKTFTSSGTLSISSGTSVTWTATPATGYTLSSTSGSFTMTANRTLAPTATAKTFTVKATVSPQGASANLSWKLEWEPSRSLSSDVSNYVTLTVSADGMSATLTFKKAFTGAVMILTCYVTDNPTVKATCTVECS